MAEYGMPQRVVNRALQNGAERKCLDAGPEGGACENCTRIVLEALDHFYHSFPTNMVEDLIRLDVATEEGR